MSETPNEYTVLSRELDDAHERIATLGRENQDLRNQVLNWKNEFDGLAEQHVDRVIEVRDLRRERDEALQRTDAVTGAWLVRVAEERVRAEQAEAQRDSATYLAAEAVNAGLAWQDAANTWRGLWELAEAREAMVREELEAVDSMRVDANMERDMEEAYCKEMVVEAADWKTIAMQLAEQADRWQVYSLAYVMTLMCHYCRAEGAWREASGWIAAHKPDCALAAFDAANVERKNA